MIARALFGLAALIPAAFNPAPAEARTLAVPLCSGDGVARSINIPVQPGAPGRSNADFCCAKGCHAGGQRKRSSCHI